MPLDLDERNKLIRKLRAEGCTLESIGSAFGLTRERIRMLTLGISPKPLGNRHPDLPRSETAETVVKACKAYGLAKSSVEVVIGRPVPWFDDINPAEDGFYRYLPSDRALMTAFLLGKGFARSEILREIGAVPNDPVVNLAESRLMELNMDVRREDGRKSRIAAKNSR